MRRLLSDGEWHTRTGEIADLLPDVPDAWFLQISRDLGVEYRWYRADGQVLPGPGSRSEWRLPAD